MAELRPLLERLEELVVDNRGLDIKVRGNYLPNRNEDAYGPGRFGIWDDLTFSIYLRGVNTFFGNFMAWLTAQDSWSIHCVRVRIGNTIVYIDRDEERIVLTHASDNIRNHCESFAVNRNYRVRVRRGDDQPLN